MIELLTWATPNGSRPAIMLEEVELPYTVRLVDITAGAQFAPECQSAFKRDPGSAFNWDPCRC